MRRVYKRASANVYKYFNFCTELNQLRKTLEWRESPITMQNLLKSCNLEQIRPLLIEKSIDLASLKLLVDDTASKQAQQRVQKALIDDCGLQLLDVLKICDRLRDAQPLHFQAQKSVSPMRSSRQMAQNMSRVTPTGYQFRGGNKRVQALLAQPKPASSTPVKQNGKAQISRATSNSQRESSRNQPTENINNNQQNAKIGSLNQMVTRPNHFKPMAHNSQSTLSHPQDTEAQRSGAQTEQLFRDALGRAPQPTKANQDSEIVNQTLSSNDSQYLPPKSVNDNAIQQDRTQHENREELVQPNNNCSEPQQITETEVLTQQNQVVSQEPPVAVDATVQKAKTFDELNKPMDYVENQERVAEKLNQFRESNIEQFGSSTVPTPALKDVYKQCAGMESSEQLMAGEQQNKIERGQAEMTVQDGNQQPPRELNAAAEEKTRQHQAAEQHIINEEQSVPSSFIPEENNLASNTDLVTNSQPSQLDEASSNVLQQVQQVTIDGRLSSQEASYPQQPHLQQLSQQSQQLSQQQQLNDQQYHQQNSSFLPYQNQQNDVITQDDVAIPQQHQQQQIQPQTEEVQESQQTQLEDNDVNDNDEGDEDQKHHQERQMAEQHQLQSDLRENAEGRSGNLDQDENDQDERLESINTSGQESTSKWNEVMTQIDEAKKVASDANMNISSSQQESLVEENAQVAPVSKAEDEENSYMEPSYDIVDQSESYEPTYHVKAKPIQQLMSDQQQTDQQPILEEEIVGRPASDNDESIDNYECTHDQQLSDHPDDSDQEQDQLDQQQFQSGRDVLGEDGGQASQSVYVEDNVDCLMQDANMAIGGSQQQENVVTQEQYDQVAHVHNNNNEQHMSSEEDDAEIVQQPDSAQVNLYEKRFMQVDSSNQQQEQQVPSATAVIQQEIDQESSSDSELEFTGGRQGSQVMMSGGSLSSAERKNLWMSGRRQVQSPDQQNQNNNLAQHQSSGAQEDQAVSDESSSESSSSSSEQDHQNNDDQDMQMRARPQQLISNSIDDSQPGPNNSYQNQDADDAVYHAQTSQLHGQQQERHHQVVPQVEAISHQPTNATEIQENQNVQQHTTNYVESGNDDTSSEGREAIETTRVANEAHMVEVRDKDFNPRQITLCEIGTQTESPETHSIAITAKPPTPTDQTSQTPIIRVNETATQMSPLIKQSVVEVIQEEEKMVVSEERVEQLTPVEEKPAIVVDQVDEDKMQEEKEEVQADLQVDVKQESSSIDQVQVEAQGPEEYEKEDLQETVKQQTLAVQELSPDVKKTMSPITKQFLAESKKTSLSSRTEKLLNGSANVQVDDSPTLRKESFTSPTPKNKIDNNAIEQQHKHQIDSPPKERVTFDSPSKIIAQKKRDLNKPFISKIDKRALLQSRMANNQQASASTLPFQQQSLNQQTMGSSMNASNSLMASSNKIPTIVNAETPGSLVLQKAPSSSVSSSIAEFIPMRSIMKPLVNASPLASLNRANPDQQDYEKTTQSKYQKKGDRAANAVQKKQKKVVRFDDMILIGEEQAQIFLSDEEASIIEKKATPTKLNMQSSAQLRKQIREQKELSKQSQRSTPKTVSIDNILEQQQAKRRRTQTSHYWQQSSTSSQNQTSEHQKRSSSMLTDSDQKQNTQTSSPEDHEKANSSGSSPDKHDMNIDFDYSYEGDSDVRSNSKLKKRRSKKHHHSNSSKSKQMRKSQSPDKYQQQQNTSASKRQQQQNQRSSSGYEDIDAMLDENSHDSQAEQARRVADVIKGQVQRKQSRHSSVSSASGAGGYQPLEQTRKGMTASHQARLQESIQSLLYPNGNKQASSRKN